MRTFIVNALYLDRRDIRFTKTFSCLHQNEVMNCTLKKTIYIGKPVNTKAVKIYVCPLISHTKLF